MYTAPGVFISELDDMDPSSIIRVLAQNIDAISGLVAGVSPVQAVWKPTSVSWSVLEVVNHLADEESEDFRTRLCLILDNQHREWPPIAPEIWVHDRRYNERDLCESLDRFVAERKESLDWLGKLENPDWSTATPPQGRKQMRADQMLMSWLAHDLLHMRQLTRLSYECLAHRAEPLSLDYAG